jgi:uncharacterized protein (TIGR02246 family)
MREDGMSLDLLEDRIHVASLIRGLEAAWNRFDAKSCAGFFAEDADFMHIPGQRVSGLAAIEAAHQHLFETVYKASVVTYRIEDMSRVGDGGLSIRLLQALRYTAETGRAVLYSRPTLVIASERGFWRIASMQSTNEAETVGPALAPPQFRVVPGFGRRGTRSASPRPRPIGR